MSIDYNTTTTTSSPDVSVMYLHIDIAPLIKEASQKTRFQPIHHHTRHLKIHWVHTTWWCC